MAIPLNKSFRDLLIQKIAARYSRWQRLLRRGVVAVIEQGLIGGSNFVIALVLARRSSAEQYGSYAMAFEAFLLMSVLYIAVVLEPMSVFGPSVYKDRPQEYLGVLLWIHVGIAVVTFAVFSASALVLRAFSSSNSLPLALAGAGVAVPNVLLFWLTRRAFYVKLESRGGTLGPFVYCFVLLGGILITFWLGLLSSLVAFLLMAAAGFIASLILLKELKPLMRLGPAHPPISEVGRRHWFFGRQALRSALVTWSVAPTDPNLMEVGRRHWHYGRWALGSSVVNWSGGAIYYLMLGGSRGLAETGSLKALLNLGSPIGQFFAALSLVFLPYASRIHQRYGLAGIKRVVRQITVVYIGGTTVLWAVIVLLREPILRLLYGGKYMQLTSLLPWTGLGSVLRIAATAQAIPLRAMQSPKLVFKAYAASSAVAVFVGGPAALLFGLRGAVLAEVLVNAAAAITGFILLRRRLRQETGAPAVATQRRTETVGL